MSSKTPTSKSLQEILAGAKRPEKTVRLCLRGDLNAEFEALEGRLNEIRSKDRGEGRLNPSTEARDIARDMEQLKDEMAASTVPFVLRALPRREFQKLFAAHPPEKGNDTHKQLGYNPETFYEALVKASVVDPELDEDTWVRLSEEVWTSAQWAALVAAASALNMNEVSVPFSAAASLTLRGSDET